MMHEQHQLSHHLDLTIHINDVYMLILIASTVYKSTKDILTKENWMLGKTCNTCTYNVIYPRKVISNCKTRVLFVSGCI